MTKTKTSKSNQIKVAISLIDKNILNISEAISKPSMFGDEHDSGFDKAANHASLVFQQIKNILLSK